MARSWMHGVTEPQNLRRREQSPEIMTSSLETSGTKALMCLMPPDDNCLDIDSRWNILGHLRCLYLRTKSIFLTWRISRRVEL